MRLSNHLKIFLWVANFLGIFPFVLRTTENDDVRLHFRWPTYLLQLFTYLIIFFPCQLYICYHKLSTNPVMNEVIFVCCTLYIFFVYATLGIFNIVYRKRIEMLFEHFRLMRTQLLDLGMTRNCQVGFRTSIVVAELLYLVVVTFYLFLIYFYSYNIIFSFLFTLGYTVPKVIIIAHSFLYANYLLILHSKFATINKRMGRCRIKIDKLKILLKTYENLLTIFRKVNKHYGIVNLLVVIIYVIWISYELYHLILLLDQKKIDGFDRNLVLFASSWIAVQFSSLFIMVMVHTITKYEAERFVPLLINFSIKKNLDNQVNFWLSKLIHQKIRPENGLFSLDFTLLFTILGTFTTFLAVFTQFSKDL